MARNKLLPVPPMPPKDPRCTGRTTTIALDLVSTAIRTPGQWVNGVDHHEPGERDSTKLLAQRVDSLVKALELKFVTVRIVLNFGRSAVQVRSDIWED